MADVQHNSLSGSQLHAPGTHASSHKGDGSDAIANATTSVSGLESAADKTKLNGIETGATADQIASEVPFTPTGTIAATNVQSAIAEVASEAGGGGGSVSSVDGETGAVDLTDNYAPLSHVGAGGTAHANAVAAGAAGFLTGSDKTKLDGIASGADATPDASETVKGKAEIATQTETDTGTDDARTVTPAKLAGRTSTETRSGVIEIATQTETNTGTDDVRAVTPAKLANYASLGSGHVIKDEGTARTQRANLNFIGAGVTATDNSGTSATDVTIPGGSGVAVEEDGSEEGTGIDRFDFTAGLDVSVSGTQATISASGGSGVSGYTPYALPIGVPANTSFINSVSLAAGGATAVIPIAVDSAMSLDAVLVATSDSSGTRGPIEFAIFVDSTNASNSLDVVSGAVGTLAAYTATGAAIRSVPPTSPPAALAPGTYFLAVKNNHATNALTLQVLNSSGTFSTSNNWQTKTLSTSAFGSTLDMVAATWTKQTSLPGVRLAGRVFGQSTAF